MPFRERLAEKRAPAHCAGMWRRFGGASVDLYFTGGLLFLANRLGLVQSESPVPLIAYFVYFASSYTGPWQATLGQRIFGVYTTTRQGVRLSMWRAALRAIVILLCLLVPQLLIGGRTPAHRDFVLSVYIIVAALIWYAPAWFTREKRALPDLVSGSRVRIGRR
jgi:uncharacterized RDD family membrane protein YckC